MARKAKSVTIPYAVAVGILETLRVAIRSAREELDEHDHGASWENEILAEIQLIEKEAEALADAMQKAK